MTEADRIQAALRAMAATGRDAVHVAPFTAYLDPADALRFLSYAIPDEGARDWPGDAVAALIAAMESRGRIPRLEVVASCWPGLREALAAQGFGVEADLLGMACDPGTVIDIPPPAGITFERVDRDAPAEAILALMRTGDEVFQAPPAPGSPEARVARFRERGSGGVLARLPDGAPAGSAASMAPRLGVTEIAGGVLAEHRRRGIAGALTAAATRAAFADGAELAFLTPGDDGAARVYARAGFRPSVRCLYLARG